MKLKVDIDELIPFLGKTIYRAENVLVELCANSYDADADLVRVSTSGESQQILIKDNGCGMNKEDIDELVTIAKSRKKEMIKRGEATPKYHRKLLGCFGIGIISFLALGDYIKIFTRKDGDTPIFLEIKKFFDEKQERSRIAVSGIEENEKYAQHLLQPNHGTTIEINSNRWNFLQNYKLIRDKLSNLPLSNNFKIELNELEIGKEDFDEASWLKKEFGFTLDSIDPSYKSNMTVYVNHQNTIDSYKRGVYLVVNGRVIGKDLYSAIYTDLTSPGTIGSRVRGLIKADYLDKSIQANREDFFDSEIINEIKKKITEPLNQTTIYYSEQMEERGREEKHAELLQRIEKAKYKDNAPNRHLDQLGINFRSNPEFEQEVVIIIAQLCQKDLLPFKIIDYNSGSHIDCIVKWPIEQKKRHPNFISELEVETTLDGFFRHSHDFRTKPDICCWVIKPAALERAKTKYINDRPDSMVDIQLQDAEDPKHFGHQKELHFTVQDEHNQRTTFILRVYVISQIIENLCKQPTGASAK